MLSASEAQDFAKASGIGIKKHSSGLGYTAWPNEKGKYPNDEMLKSANHKIPGLDSFFDKDFAKHSKIAQNAFPNHWETFTSQMKTALVDHAFQLGGFSGWPGLVGEATNGAGPQYSAMIANYGSSLNASQTPNRVAARQELIRKAQMRREEKYLVNNAVMRHTSIVSETLISSVRYTRIFQALILAVLLAELELALQIVSQRCYPTVNTLSKLQLQEH